MSTVPARQEQDAGERLLRIRVTLKGRPIRSQVFTKEHVVIGRSPDADLFLDNPGVSREHLRLERARNGDYVLQDVGSANGTLLNDQPVTSKRLLDNDVIQIGKFSLIISYEDDRRHREALNRALQPSADDGTMVLSAAELDVMIKKAHAAENDPVKGPWPDAQANKGAARVNRIHTLVAFVLGTLFGAAVTFLVVKFLRH